MDADGQPSACDASQISQRAASRSPGSSLKTASNTRSSMTWEAKRSGCETTSRSPSRRADGDKRPSSSGADELGEAVMAPMLAKRRDEGEGEEERNRDAEDRGDDVPLARGRRIPDPSPPQSPHPAHDGAQTNHVQDRAQPRHRRRDGSQGALAKGERAAGWTGRTKL